MASRLGMQRLSRFRKTLLKNRKVTLSSGSNTSKAEGSARHGGFWHESVVYLITYATLGCLGQTNCCAGDRQPVGVPPSDCAPPCDHVARASLENALKSNFTFSTFLLRGENTPG